METKYGDFELINIKEDRYEPLVYYGATYQFKDGNRRISLGCKDVKNGEYILRLTYSDLKLEKQAEKEEQKLIMQKNKDGPDYDI